MSEHKYQKYQHVEKVGSDEVDGILLGTCYIFPKIDGTNGHIWLEDGILRYGSRRREINIEDDNAGFAAWCAENESPLWNLLLDLPEGAHVYGEWLVPHSLKTYRNDAWRKFYVFDVVVGDRHLPYDEYKPIFDKHEYGEYIPPLRIIKNPQLDNIMRVLDENHYLMPSPEQIGEGVVIKNYDFVNRFGRQVWAKVVTSEFKEKHYKEMGAPVTSGTAYVEEAIVEEFVTKAFVDKILAKIKTESGWNSKKIPQLLGTAFYDLVREHSWDFIKKHKNPKIDFKTLNRFCIIKVKEHLPEVF